MSRTPFTKALARALFLMLLAPFYATAQFSLDGEAGVAVKGGYNQIRLPGNVGTEFNLFSKDFSTRPIAYYRVRASATFLGRHTFSLLAAPTTTSSTSNGTIGQPITFNGVTFGQGRGLTGTYTFNSYRATYRFNLVHRPKLKLGIGASLQLRQAAIKLDNGEQSTTYSNLGFVPLLNLLVDWRPLPHLGFLLEGDALAGGSMGRAEDIFGGVTVPINKVLTLKAGYRVLEGGVNIGEIYNFTWINYFGGGLILTL